MISEDCVVDLKQKGETPPKEIDLAMLIKIAPSAEWLRRKARELLALANAMEMNDRDLLFTCAALDPDAAPTPKAIIEAVCVFWRVPRTKVLSKDRTQHVATARQAAMYLIRKHTNLSFPDIGDELNRDHSTAVHAFNVIQRRVQTDAPFARLMERVMSTVAAGKPTALVRTEVAA